MTTWAAWTPERRAYQLAWKRRTRRERRAAYLADKFCVDCGATSFLEVDHVDPSQKVNHRDIWFWCESRRLEELAKCVIRCDVHHDARHKDNGGRWRKVKPRHFCGL